MVDIKGHLQNYNLFTQTPENNVNYVTQAIRHSLLTFITLIYNYPFFTLNLPKQKQIISR